MSLAINVKGPSDLKLAITVPEGATVAELKGLITQANADYPVDRQRLIYSGRVLKDEELCSKYGLSNGHTIHLVSLSGCVGGGCVIDRAGEGHRAMTRASH